MEIILIIFLVLLLFGLHSTNQSISELSRSIKSRENLEEVLDKIYRVLGGDLKLREIEQKEIKDLKERLINQLILETPKLTIKQAEQIALKKFDQDDPSFEYSRLSVEGWIKTSKEYVWNRNKYGNLLDDARKFISGKKEVAPEEIEKALNTDYTGARWLLESLEREERVRRIFDDKEPYRIKYWKVA